MKEETFHYPQNIFPRKFICQTSSIPQQKKYFLFELMENLKNKLQKKKILIKELPFYRWFVNFVDISMMMMKGFMQNCYSKKIDKKDAVQLISNPQSPIYDRYLAELLNKYCVGPAIYLATHKITPDQVKIDFQIRLVIPTREKMAQFQLDHSTRFQLSQIKKQTSKLIFKNRSPFIFPLISLFSDKMVKPITNLPQEISSLRHMFQKNHVNYLQKVWEVKGSLLKELYVITPNSNLFKDIRKLILTIQIRTFKKEKMFNRILPGISEVMAGLLKHFNLPKMEVLLQKFMRQHRPAQRGGQLLIIFCKFLKEKNEIVIPNEIERIDNVLLARIKEIKRQEERRVELEVNYNEQRQLIKDFIAHDKLFYDGTSNTFDYLQQILPQKQTRSKFTKMVEASVDYTCLRCTPYFELKKNINMDHMRQTAFFCFDSIQQFDPKQIKVTLLSLLNSGGGICLFDVKREYRSVYPVGAVIPEEKKEKLISQIKDLLDSFLFLGNSPLEQEKAAHFVDVDFVPIKDNEEDRGQILSQAIVNEEGFIQGRYVTRIKISPSDSSRVFYFMEGGQIKSYYNLPKGQIISVPPAKIRILMGKKIRSFYHESPHIVAKKPQNYFNHSCWNPHKGYPLTNDPKLKSYESLMLRERHFQHMSMVVCKDSHMLRIRQLLGFHHIEFLLTRIFTNYNFLETKYLAVLYHNIPNIKELEKIFEGQTVGNGKKIFFVEVTYSLLLKQRSKSNPLSKEELMSFKDIFREEIPKENFELNEYVERKGNEEIQVHYIETESKTATLFLYYLMNHFKTKALMINPKNQRSVPEKGKKLIYSSQRGLLSS